MNEHKSVITLDIKQADPASGEFEAILSAPTVDRDGEVVDAKAFEPLPERIPIDIDHGMSVTTTVGSGVPFYEGDLLRFRGSFASTELGQEVRTLVTKGHISRMSVAFMDAVREKDEKDGKMHVRKAELLNAAIVAIPSNREAAILAAKQLVAEAVDEKVGARNSQRDLERIQATHDHMVELGAACSKSAAADKSPAETDPEDTTAAPAAVEPPAEVLLAHARALIAQAHLTLLP